MKLPGVAAEHEWAARVERRGVDRTACQQLFAVRVRQQRVRSGLAVSHGHSGWMQDMMARSPLDGRKLCGARCRPSRKAAEQRSAGENRTRRPCGESNRLNETAAGLRPHVLGSCRVCASAKRRRTDDGRSNLRPEPGGAELHVQRRRRRYASLGPSNQTPGDRRVLAPRRAVCAASAAGVPCCRRTGGSGLRRRAGGENSPEALRDRQSALCAGQRRVLREAERHPREVARSRRAMPRCQHRWARPARHGRRHAGCREARRASVVPLTSDPDLCGDGTQVRVDRRRCQECR